MDLDDTDVPLPQRMTIIGIERGEKIKHGDEGKVLWIWRGDDGEKEVVEVSLTVNKVGRAFTGYDSFNIPYIRYFTSHIPSFQFSASSETVISLCSIDHYDNIRL